MEDRSESVGNPSQLSKPASACFTPRISETTAHYLVNTIAGTAKMVQAAVEAQKSAQLAYFHTEKSLRQAQVNYIEALALCEGLMGRLSLPDYQGLFQHMSKPPMPYSEFCTIIRHTEKALLDPILGWEPDSPDGRDLRSSSERSCLPDTSNNSILGGVHERQLCRSLEGSEMDEDGTEEEESRPLQVRGRNPSRHKQVETVLLEDQMGGTYLTHRRRSPRRSPSAGMEGLSPLVSEQELHTIQPLICCPSRPGGSGKFLSKVTWRRKDQPPQESSDSNPDHLENSAKDTGSI